jgi:type II secretory pathway component GspD/PulD (secretin)
MNINVKSSTLGSQSQGSVIPDELNREAVANVLVKDGETIVLGGILKDTSQDAESGVPYLKDIPVLAGYSRTSGCRRTSKNLWFSLRHASLLPAQRTFPLPNSSGASKCDRQMAVRQISACQPPSLVKQNRVG